MSYNGKEVRGDSHLRNVPFETASENRVILWGNECNISQKPMRCRVNCRRELLPWRSLRGGESWGAAEPAFPWDSCFEPGLLPPSTLTRLPSRCLVLPESPYQNPMTHDTSSPPQNTNFWRGKKLGKQLSGQIRVLWLVAGRRSARRQPPKTKSSLLVTRCEKWVCLLCSIEHMFVKYLLQMRYLLGAVGDIKKNYSPS